MTPRFFISILSLCSHGNWMSEWSFLSLGFNAPVSHHFAVRVISLRYSFDGDTDQCPLGYWTVIIAHPASVSWLISSCFLPLTSALISETSVCLSPCALHTFHLQVFTHVGSSFLPLLHVNSPIRMLWFTFSIKLFLTTLFILLVCPNALCL